MAGVDFAFLDSGTGGIPYMLSLADKQKSASCVYLGDTAHFPYGEKSSEQIKECAFMAVKLMIKKWNPKTIIIACNTISVTALDFLRKEFPSVPFVGTVPAIKLAAKVTKNKRIGFLATRASVNHPYSQHLIDEFAGNCTVLRRGDPQLVEFIEKKYFKATKEERIAGIKPALDFFIENGCDTIILGCTHFTHVAKLMQETVGEKIKIIDSREGVSNQALKVEKEFCLTNRELNPAEKDCSPVAENKSFFVTKAGIPETEEYKILCSSLGIPWGGIVNFS